MNPAFNPTADMELRLVHVADQAMADVVRAAPNIGVSPSADSPVIPPKLARRVSPIKGDLSEGLFQDRSLKP